MATTSTTIRLPKVLHEQVKKLAEQDSRSINNMYNLLITKAVKTANEGKS